MVESSTLKPTILSPTEQKLAQLTKTLEKFKNSRMLKGKVKRARRSSDHVHTVNNVDSTNPNANLYDVQTFEYHSEYPEKSMDYIPYPFQDELSDDFDYDVYDNVDKSDDYESSFDLYMNKQEQKKEGTPIVSRTWLDNVIQFRDGLFGKHDLKNAGYNDKNPIGNPQVKIHYPDFDKSPLITVTQARNAPLKYAPSTFFATRVDEIGRTDPTIFIKTQETTMQNDYVTNSTANNIVGLNQTSAQLENPAILQSPGLTMNQSFSSDMFASFLSPVNQNLFDPLSRLTNLGENSLTTTTVLSRNKVKEFGIKRIKEIYTKKLNKMEKNVNTTLITHNVQNKNIHADDTVEKDYFSDEPLDYIEEYRGDVYPLKSKPTYQYQEKPHYTEKYPKYNDYIPNNYAYYPSSTTQPPLQIRRPNLLPRKHVGYNYSPTSRPLHRSSPTRHPELEINKPHLLPRKHGVYENFHQPLIQHSEQRQLPSYSNDQEQTVLPDLVLPLKPTPPSSRQYLPSSNIPQPPVPHNYLEHSFILRLERNNYGHPRRSKSEDLTDSDEMDSDSNNDFYARSPPGKNNQPPPLLREGKQKFPRLDGQYPPLLNDYLPPTLFDTLPKLPLQNFESFLLPPTLGTYLPPKLTEPKNNEKHDLKFSPPKLGMLIENLLV